MVHTSVCSSSESSYPVPATTSLNQIHDSAHYSDGLQLFNGPTSQSPCADSNYAQFGLCQLDLFVASQEFATSMADWSICDA